jgi:hypothetical protein
VTAAESRELGRRMCELSLGKPETMANCCMGPADFSRCAHTQQLRTWIANGILTPESWRDEEKPDLGSAWENAVREDLPTRA